MASTKRGDSGTNRLPQLIAQAWPPGLWQDLHFLVAVSGGADSVALLRSLVDIKREAGGKGRLLVAHFNHRQRAEDSDHDARWVSELGQGLGLKVVVGCPALSAPLLTSEQHARDARYAFLLETAEQHGARFVATAHTADDQAETILHRILRGASIQGLSGIPFTRPMSQSVDLVRPMLMVSRSRVEGYLGDLGQGFRTDSTNAESTFTRNKLRNLVLPMLREQIGPGVDGALVRLGEQAGEAHEVIQALSLTLLDRAIRRDPASNVLRIDSRLLASESPLVVREACKLAWRNAGWPEQEMGAQQWRCLHSFLLAEDGPPALHLPGGIEARRDRSGVTLRPC